MAHVDVALGGVETGLGRPFNNNGKRGWCVR